MLNLVKRILSGIIIAIPILLLTIRFVINLVITGSTQLVYQLLGESHRCYWNMENEWVQYQMDMNQWYDLWKNGK